MFKVLEINISKKIRIQVNNFKLSANCRDKSDFYYIFMPRWILSDREKSCKQINSSVHIIVVNSVRKSLDVKFDPFFLH